MKKITFKFLDLENFITVFFTIPEDMVKGDRTLYEKGFRIPFTKHLELLWNIFLMIIFNKKYSIIKIGDIKVELKKNEK